MADNIAYNGILSGSMTQKFKTCFDVIRTLPEYRNKWIVKSEWVKIINERCKASLQGSVFTNKHTNIYLNDDNHRPDNAKKMACTSILMETKLPFAKLFPIQNLLRRKLIDGETFS